MGCLRFAIPGPTQALTRASQEALEEFLAGQTTPLEPETMS